jgi:hypothetical protein
MPKKEIQAELPSAQKKKKKRKEKGKEDVHPKRN